MAEQSASQPTTFGIGIGELFRTGVRGVVFNWKALSVAATATFVTYGVFRYLASQATTERGQLGLDLLGLVLASVIALPWYRAALDSAAEKKTELTSLLTSLQPFKDQLIASIFFYAAVLFGRQYLFGLPALLVLLLYAFYGFVVVERTRPGGLRALGYSVMLGQGRRVGIGAIGALLIILNLFGAIAIGFRDQGLADGLAWVLTVAGLLITTNISMVVGAVLYRHLTENT